MMRTHGSISENARSSRSDGSDDPTGTVGDCRRDPSGHRLDSGLQFGLNVDDSISKLTQPIKREIFVFFRTKRLTVASPKTLVAPSTIDDKN